MQKTLAFPMLLPASGPSAFGGKSFLPAFFKCKLFDWFVLKALHVYLKFQY
jgi:hypothetical protein